MGVIRRQSIKNAISGYIGIALGFINLIFIQSHFLTKEELGLTRLLYSFSLIIATIVPLGAVNSTVKFFPLFRDPDKKHHGYFGFMSLFPIAGFILCFTGIWLLKDFIFNQYRSESPLFLEYFNYVFPLIFCNGFINVLAVYCASNLKSTIPSYINDIIVRLLTIAVVSIYFLKWISFNTFLIFFCGIYVIQLTLLFAYILHFDKPTFKIDWTFIKSKNIPAMISYGIMLWFAAISALGLQYFDSILIGKYLPLSFLGIYTIAAFIPTVIDAPLNAVDRIAAPRISSAWQSNDHNQIAEIYRQSSLYLFMLGGFLFLLINCNIQSFLTFLPEGYESGIPVVFIISVGTLFNMATGLNSAILFTSSKYRYGAFFVVALAMLTIGLNMFLIPRFGIAGAALATSLAKFIFNSMLIITVYKFFNLQPFDKKNANILLALIVIFPIAYFIPHYTHPVADIILRSALISGLYLAAIHMMNIAPELLEKIKLKKSV